MNDLQPICYEIRLQGQLAERWSERFEGMTITAEANGTTRLTGPVEDQAASSACSERYAMLDCR